MYSCYGEGAHGWLACGMGISVMHAEPWKLGMLRSFSLQIVNLMNSYNSCTQQQQDKVLYKRYALINTKAHNCH